MESLRTQLDNLQWEVNRLGAENRQLREANPEASCHVDLEAELQHSRAKSTQMVKRVRTLEEQLAETTHAATASEELSREAEERAREQTQTFEGTQRRLEKATVELQQVRAAASVLQEALATREAQTKELLDELKTKDEELQVTVE